jgi:hypothetical protein
MRVYLCPFFFTPGRVPCVGAVKHEACVRNLLRWEFLAEHALGPAVDGVFRVDFQAYSVRSNS